MKLKVSKFQAGGAMVEDPAAGAPQEAPTEQGAPAGAGGPEEMLMQLAEAAMQALQNQDCQAALSVCQAFLQMVQGMAGEPAQSEPVYRKGGKLVRRLS